MNISICITVYNEEKTITALLESIVSQSVKAKEIIIVDAKSSDSTVEIIRHFQKKYSKIKLLVEKCSRSKGRNLAVEMSKGEVIAMTDAGCVLDVDWLKNITKPFQSQSVDVVAGFYTMTGDNLIQKAESVFMGITPDKFNVNYLPSTRSIAFTKAVWEKVGGFPERMDDTAEDTGFNYRLLSNQTRISRVKGARVEWSMPETLIKFQESIYRYAKGDAKSKIWLFPGKGIMSHNIKASLILLRYILALIFLIFCIANPPLFIFFFFGLFVYLFWAFRKVNGVFSDWKVAIYGPVLQIVSDVSVMRGLLSGIIA